MESNVSFRELVKRAISGDIPAMELLVEAYMPLINKHSFVNGVFDEDCRQFLLMHMLIATKRFAVRDKF